MTGLSRASDLSCDGRSGSARNSSMPREMWTAPLTLPPACSSGASRTSTTTALPLAIISRAWSGVIRGTAALAAASISFTLVGMAISFLWDMCLDAKRSTPHRSSCRLVEPQRADGVLLEDQRVDLGLEAGVLEVLHPAVGREHRVVGAEQHL